MRYFLHNSDVQINIKNNEIKLFNRDEEDWNIILADTGEETATAGDLRVLKNISMMMKIFVLLTVMD